MSGRQKRNAFAVIHFGGNPKYLELELYFFKMLRQYTRNDIVYLFSVNDTPPAFVDAVRPLVTEAIPYDDRGITYEVPFKSEYKNFNTLRTCNFIFAYTLDKYDKVCIIESDMVVMKNLDPIFNLKTPAVLTYYIGDRNLKFHDRVRNDRREVLDKCRDMGRVNGGVMVINPSPRLFAEYNAKIVDVVQRNCKYPNETLFEYVNNDYFNLPVQYNLSHYHAQPARLQTYQLDPTDIFVYHFNETDYKHIDIIKNPVDEKGDNWLELIDRQPKYVIRKLPIFYYKRNVFDRYRSIIEPLMIEATRPKAVEAKAKVSETPVKVKVSETPVKAKVAETPVKAKVVSDKVETKPVTDKVAEKPVVDKPVVEKPVVDKPVTDKLTDKVAHKVTDKPAEKPVAEEKVIVNPKTPSPVKKEKCPKGTRRNKKTGLCEPYAKASSSSLPKANISSDEASLPKAVSKASLPKAEASSDKTKKSLTPQPILSNNAKKCPKGTRRNRRTGICEPKIVPLQMELIQAKHPEVKQPKVEVEAKRPEVEAKQPEVKQPEAKQLVRCPKGTHRNKKTGECVPNK